METGHQHWICDCPEGWIYSVKKKLCKYCKARIKPMGAWRFTKGRYEKVR